MKWKEKYQPSKPRLTMAARRLAVKYAPKEFWIEVTEAGEFTGLDRHGTPYGYDYVAGPIKELKGEMWAVSLNKSSGQFLVSKGFDENTIVGRTVKFERASFADHQGSIVKYLKMVAIKEEK